MNKKRKILTAIAGLTSLTLLGVVAINLNAPSALYRSNAQTKTKEFDSDLANEYWVQDKVYALKKIKMSDNTDNDISAQVDYASNFSGGRFCSIQYCGVKTLRVMVGVNNLQSFSFTFHCDYTSVIDDPTDVHYEATARFCGTKFNFNYPVSDDHSPALFTESFSNSELVRNRSYTISWSKTDEPYTIRHLVFDLNIRSSSMGKDTYSTNFLDSFNVTWSC